MPAALHCSDSFSDGGVQRFAFRIVNIVTLRPARLHQAVKGGRLPNRRWGLYTDAQDSPALRSSCCLGASLRRQWVNIGTAIAIFAKNPVIASAAWLPVPTTTP